MLGVQTSSCRRYVSPRFTPVFGTVCSDAVIERLAAMTTAAPRVVALAKEAGIALKPAGATHPLGRVPTTGRFASPPLFPSCPEIAQSAEGVALSSARGGREIRHASGCQRGSDLIPGIGILHSWKNFNNLEVAVPEGHSAQVFYA